MSFADDVIAPGQLSFSNEQHGFTSAAVPKQSSQGPSAPDFSSGNQHTKGASESMPRPATGSNDRNENYSEGGYHGQRHPSDMHGGISQAPMDEMMIDPENVVIFWGRNHALSLYYESPLNMAGMHN